MQVKLCENLSKNELDGIKRMFDEAFISNELFHEFGDINTHRELVLKYMEWLSERIKIQFLVIKV